MFCFSHYDRRINFVQWRTKSGTDRAEILAPQMLTMPLMTLIMIMVSKSLDMSNITDNNQERVVISTRAWLDSKSCEDLFELLDDFSHCIL